MNYFVEISSFAAANASEIHNWGRTSVQAAASVLTAATIYWMTTRKEKKGKNDLENKAKGAPNVVVDALIEMTERTRDEIGLDLMLRDLMQELDSLASFCEFVESDVYKALGLEAFSQFSVLKRIVYHYREHVQTLKDQLSMIYVAEQRTRITNTNLEAIQARVRNRVRDFQFPTRIDLET